MKKHSIYLVLILIFMLAACEPEHTSAIPSATPTQPLTAAPTQTTSPAPTATPTLTQMPVPSPTVTQTATPSPSSTLTPAPLTETALLALLTDTCGVTPVTHLSLDMNGDGNNELIGVISIDYQYSIWYVNPEGTVCERVFDKIGYYDECAIDTIPYQNQLHAVVNFYNMMGSNKSFSVFALQNDSILPLVESHYGTAGTTLDGRPCVTVDDYDGCWDPVLEMNLMHTWKTTYIQFDETANTYKEIAAKKISEEEFLSFTNGKEILDAALAKEITETSIKTEYEFFLRENGILHIQCYAHDADGGITNYYYTLTYDNDTITTSPEYPDYGVMYEKLTDL